MQFGKHHRFGRLGLGGADADFDTLLKRLTSDLDALAEAEGVRPNLIAMTGDLAEWGKKREFEDVARLARGLAAHLGLPIDRVLVIPGNHDINRKHCEAYFAICAAEDEEPEEPYWPKWKDYVSFFGDLYQDVDRYQFTESAPYTWFELPDLQLAVAGFNSTMRESHLDTEAGGHFGHYGYVGEGQLDWFAKRLAEAKTKGWLRIGLVHHNAIRGAEADDENLRDAPVLVSRLGDKLHLVLHGHTHDGKIGWLNRHLPALSTGSAAVKVEQRRRRCPTSTRLYGSMRTGCVCGRGSTSHAVGRGLRTHDWPARAHRCSRRSSGAT
jgi:3',5'-cyclic AMP phosphodiesterase CpdA